MEGDRKLPEGVKLAKSDTFWPEGQWFFIRDLAVPLVWSRRDGWVRYYEIDRADCYFKTEEEAMETWEHSKPVMHTRFNLATGKLEAVDASEEDSKLGRNWTAAIGTDTGLWRSDVCSCTAMQKMF